MSRARAAALPAPAVGLALALALVLALVGCTAGADRSSSERSGATGAEQPQDRRLTVLAAASLTEVFTTLARDFEARYPGVEVRLAFDSSATIADQAAQGAPADVLATADAATMRRAVAADVVTGAPSSFARNRLVMVTPAGNRSAPTSVAGLASPATVLVVCVPTAPCGSLAADLLARSGRGITPASLATDVKAVLAQVVADEADAGLVYASDAVAAGPAVRTVELPGPALTTDYLVAPLAQAADARLARAWVRHLGSPAVRSVLVDAGFDPPAGPSPAGS